MSVNYTKVDPSKLEFVQVAKLEELPNGERLFLEIDAYVIVIFNIAGKIFAIEDTCSHDDNPLGEGDMVGDYEITCPRHGARFDVRDGKALSMPATVNISAYPIRIVEGQIEIGIPTD